MGELLKTRTGEVITFLLDEDDFRREFEKQLLEAAYLKEVADPSEWYKRTWQSRV